MSHLSERSRFVLALATVAAVALLASVPGAWIRSTHGNQTSGDEPHYLVTAISLAVDGDLDVANQVRQERYRSFHEQLLAPQAATDPDGRKVVPHDPLLPALLALPMQLGGWLWARLSLALMAGLVAMTTLWTAVRRCEAGLGPATLVVAVCSGSATMAVYGSQVYPELPAALAVVVAVAAATFAADEVGVGEPGTGTVSIATASTGAAATATGDAVSGAGNNTTGPGAIRPRVVARMAAMGLRWPARLRVEDLVVVAAVVALPWLAVKYVPVAAAVAGLHLVRRWRGGARGVVGLVVGMYVVATVTYLGAHLAWYGGLTVYAAGDFFREQGSQMSVVGASPNLPGRARRLVGLFVDRDFGVATWQPAWILVVGGLAWLAARRPRNWEFVLLPSVVGWLTATFVAVTMQGWWFPGRQVVVVLPLLAIALAVWASRRRWVVVAVGMLGVAGLVTTAWLLVDGVAGRLTLVVDFALTSSPVLGLMRHVTPDYLTITATTWLVHGLWLIVLAGLATIGWRGHRGPAG